MEHTHQHGEGHDHHHHDDDQDLVHSEQHHLIKVMKAFAHYKTAAMKTTHKKRRDFHTLSQYHKDLIPTYLEKLNRVDNCIDQNMILITDIIKNATTFLGTTPEFDHSVVPVMDMDKVKSTLRQFVRDWSKEGERERKATYDPILNTLNEIYKDLSIENRGQIRVLVPGAGLGRLAFDIAKSGFSCQGNEFSYYMLFGSHFALNSIERPEQYDLYPFINSFSNIKSDEQQVSAIKIPDVLPTQLGPTVDFSMVAGDFLEIYRQPDNVGTWDVVVTCFFIDTAKNIIEYMEVIHQALKQHGTWINIGPLLYHFEDAASGEPSIELSLEQVKQVATKLGFELNQEKMIETTYTSNPDGMLTYVYDCAFWTATKL
ncbi:N2227-like protein-domain-containing protein [Pilaira anomala]|nr:N2227-like protein-domain-containing protein [Pilaira anomala]